MNELGWGWVPVLIGGSFLLLAVLGLFISMKEDFRRKMDDSLGLPPSKWKSFVSVLWDYFGRGFLNIASEVLGALVMLAILVFIFGGLIGLLIIGWEKLIEVFIRALDGWSMAAVSLSMFV